MPAVLETGTQIGPIILSRSNSGPRDRKRQRSQGPAQCQRSYLEISTQIVPIGVAVDHIAQPNRVMGGGLRLGLIASWDWSPNAEAAEWLIDEILPRLEVLDHWTLHLAGRNMPAWLVKKRSKRIHILGEVKSALHFVRSMDLMIMPFKSGGGVRVKVLEALAAGSSFCWMLLLLLWNQLATRRR